jgi:hypothetical protein
MYQPYPQLWPRWHALAIFLWRRSSTAFFKGATLKENNQ